MNCNTQVSNVNNCNSVAAGIMDNAINNSNNAINNSNNQLNGVDLKGLEVRITQHYMNEIENLRIKYNAPKDCDYHRLKACELFDEQYVEITDAPITKEMDSSIAEEITAKCSNNDFESDHLKADRILCRVLTLLGYTKTVDAFNAVQKWY